MMRIEGLLSFYKRKGNDQNFTRDGDERQFTRFVFSDKAVEKVFEDTRLPTSL